MTQAEARQYVLMKTGTAVPDALIIEHLYGHPVDRIVRIDGATVTILRPDHTPLATLSLPREPEPVPQAGVAE